MPALFIGVNEDDEDELLEAAKDGVIDDVKYMLINRSTYIDTTDENGWTPLMWAGSTYKCD